MTSQENPQKLTWLIEAHSLNQQPRNLHGIDLGTLHNCYSCIALSSCGVPKNGIRGVSYSVPIIRDPIFRTGLSSPPSKHGA